MSENKGGIFKPLLDWLCGICAFVTVTVYAVLLVHASWNFLPDWLFNVFVVCKTWAPLVVVAIAGLEFVSGKNFFVKLAFLLVLIAAVVGMFFPETWGQFVGVVKENVGA